LTLKDRKFRNQLQAKLLGGSEKEFVEKWRKGLFCISDCMI